MTGIPNYSLGTLGGSNGHWQSYSALLGGSITTSNPADLRAALAAAARNAAPSASSFRTIPSEGVRAGEIIAYRVWDISNFFEDMLESTTMFCVWEPGKPMTGNVAAGNGVHCWKTMALAKVMARGRGWKAVIGSIEIWGEIVEHEHGYRAQYAAIRSLDAMNYEHLFFSRLRKRRRLNRIREKYHLT